MIELPPEAAERLRELLRELEHPVRLLLFTREDGCEGCAPQREILETVASFSERVSLEVHDLATEAALARELAIDKAPATAVLGEQDYGLRFFGVSSGYEFTSLVQAIQLAARGYAEISPDLQALIGLIDAPTHLQVLVSPTCPYCPKVVELAQQLAVTNRNIRTDVVELGEFPELMERYQVTGVPRMVVNDRPSFSGVLPPGEAVLEILKIVKPLEYERIDALLRELEGVRKVQEPRPDHLYDTVIVGAGPAAFSAAIYAARKGMDVALIGDEPGGQLMKTATVENWLGVPQVDARELAEAFRRHVEQYPIATAVRVHVTGVERDETGAFRVHTADGGRFQARTVIWCAGKEYRRLGVPGESRFLGRGIAFCATCDAPLFMDKRVAVVGGGNSAFTAARDLLHYAREIHLITTGLQFRADPLLQEEVRRSPKVKLYTQTHVREFLGEHQLTGVRIESSDGSRREDLAVDGVFLEIGLVPNTRALEGFVSLNARGEIPVRRDQSTDVPGFFAAGDATDEPEKQLMVAAGAGTKAALAAYDFLQRTAQLAHTSMEAVWDG